MINDRDLDRVPLRCQNFMLRLMRFNRRAEYVPGSMLNVADTLSRHPVDSPIISDIDMLDEIGARVDAIQRSWPASDDKLSEILVLHKFS